MVDCPWLSLCVAVFCTHETSHGILVIQNMGVLHPTWRRQERRALKTQRKLEIMRVSRQTGSQTRKKKQFIWHAYTPLSRFFTLKWDSYADLLCSIYGSPSPGPNLHIPINLPKYICSFTILLNGPYLFFYIGQLSTYPLTCSPSPASPVNPCIADPNTYNSIPTFIFY